MTTVAAKIEALLKRSMGLHTESIGSVSVQRAVAARIAACGAERIDDYWGRLKASPVELQELIEAVVVPETWFFRDREAFAELARIARNEWKPTRATEALRLLSLPCSTGEEPYSMAMALLDANHSADRFLVDAVDISERSLAHARRAVYGKNSFRGADLAFRDRHFQKSAQGYRVKDAVRAPVRFRQGNVSADGFLADAGPYDAIFCRNLLIYFDQRTQDRTIATLHGLLTETGLLFVGPAEASILLNHQFVSAKVPLAFAFRRAANKAPAAIAASAAEEKPSPPGPRAMRSAAPAAAPTPPASQPASANRLDEAFALADRGRLAEAAALCEVQLRERGPSAQVFYLMGLIHNASGKLPEADRCYRKALFLDQNHRDALLHLALLVEQQSDPHAAKLLRRRAEKL